MSVDLCVQVAVEMLGIPDEKQFERWVLLALKGRLKADAEVTIRIVDVAEMTALNKNFRGKNGSTNVLSFPFEPSSDEMPEVGDIAICAPVVIEEAKNQGKAVEAHWAHLTIHGVLHLLGYDHHAMTDAEIMEQIEIDLLQQLGFNNPYL